MFSALVVIIFVAVGITVLFVLTSKKSKSSSGNKLKDRQAVFREANRKLAQDPHNPAGLKALSNLYFTEHVWDKAFPLYNIMLQVAAAHPEIDTAEAGLRAGICALKMEKPDDAFKGLLEAKKANPNSFEVNFYLGQAMFLKNEFEKAAPLLKKALVINAESIEATKSLGISLYKLKKYKESLPYLKRALDNTPDDKELLFSMAEALLESGNGERALKIFLHMRPDPVFGAKASLNAGTVNMSSGRIEAASQDFEIGLKHPAIPPDIAVSLRYNLAQCYLKLNNIAKALMELKTIQTMAPNFKDVPILIARYQELNQNKNLQIYLMSNQGDFVALCRKIVDIYFAKARISIQDITVNEDSTDVLSEIDTGKWQDIVVFRFYRTTGNIGELYIRDFHAKIKETKAGQGICFTAGIFNPEAKNFVEGRPITLIDKESLVKMLIKIDTSSPFSAK